jgi:glycerol-3-phosphate dehydrogenase
MTTTSIGSITSAISSGEPTYYGSGLVGGAGITINSGGSWGTTIAVDLKNNPDFNDLQKRLSDIEKQLCILKPNEALQEKYPALQEAYDAYQIILKIVNDQQT